MAVWGGLAKHKSHTSFDTPLHAPKMNTKIHQYYLFHGLKISMQSCEHIGGIKGGKSNICISNLCSSNRWKISSLWSHQGAFGRLHPWTPMENRNSSRHSWHHGGFFHYSHHGCKYTQGAACLHCQHAAQTQWVWQPILTKNQIQRKTHYNP